MNIIKSVIIIEILTAATFWTIWEIKKSVNSSNQTVSMHLKIVSMCLVVIILFCCLLDYTYPFERELKPELIATMDILPEYSPYERGMCGYWHTEYEKYGIYPGTWQYDIEYYYSKSINDWPEMDTKEYTYIFTYCQQIETLTYNVWDIIDSPTYTGAKIGHMAFRPEIDPLCIYVYRIPKMRINNDAIGQFEKNGTWD